MISVLTGEKPVYKEYEQANTISKFAIALIFIAVFHHSFFCLVNTHVLSVGAGILVATEAILLCTTLMFFLANLKEKSPIYSVLILAVLANAFFLAIFQHGFDPKNVRNLLIPILLLWLGSMYDHKIGVDKLLKTLAMIVLAVGLFELIFPDLFQKLFNVLSFQISIGRSTDKALEYAGSAFSLNGTRYGGRNLLPFLGNHRVSSVFLETVNVSNFSTLIVAWGLAKKNFADGWKFILIGVVIAILADSRFGSTLILLMVLMRYFLSESVFKYVSYFMPIIVILFCIAVGWNYTGFRDDFETRIGSTGDAILNFNPLEFFGLYGYHYKLFMDQGYARILHYDGLIILAALWISFCQLKVRKEAVLFKYLISVIISANLAISGDSIFAFKWVSILWFVLGTQLVANVYAASSKEKTTYKEKVL